LLTIVIFLLSFLTLAIINLGTELAEPFGVELAKKIRKAVKGK